MAIYFVDTHFLIWAIQKHATAGQEQRIADAAEFIETVRKEKSKFAVATISMSEFLAGIDPSNREEMKVALKKIMIIGFDQSAAELSAEIFHDHFKSAKKIPSYTRNLIKADIQILGSFATLDGDDVTLVLSDNNMAHIAKSAGLKHMMLPACSQPKFQF